MLTLKKWNLYFYLAIGASLLSPSALAEESQENLHTPPKTVIAQPVLPAEMKNFVKVPAGVSGVNLEIEITELDKRTGHIRAKKENLIHPECAKEISIELEEFDAAKSIYPIKFVHYPQEKSKCTEALTKECKRAPYGECVSLIDAVDKDGSPVLKGFGDELVQSGTVAYRQDLQDFEGSLDIPTSLKFTSTEDLKKAQETADEVQKNLEVASLCQKAKEGDRAAVEELKSKGFDDATVKKLEEQIAETEAKAVEDCVSSASTLGAIRGCEKKAVELFEKNPTKARKAVIALLDMNEKIKDEGISPANEKETKDDVAERKFDRKKLKIRKALLTEAKKIAKTLAKPKKKKKSKKDEDLDLDDDDLELGEEDLMKVVKVKIAELSEEKLMKAIESRDAENFYRAHAEARAAARQLKSYARNDEEAAQHYSTLNSATARQAGWTQTWYGPAVVEMPSKTERAFMQSMNSGRSGPQDGQTVADELNGYLGRNYYSSRFNSTF